MSFWVYVIHNIINNKVYVGYTNDPDGRWKEHKYFSVGGKEKYPEHYQAIHAAITKYGVNNFIFKAFQEFINEEECKKAEMYWIKYFNSRPPNGYNLTNGGEGASGRKCSEEMKEKGRTTKIKNGSIKLTWDIVHSIREKRESDNYTYSELGKMFGVTVSNIKDIINNKNWKDQNYNPPTKKNIHKGSKKRKNTDSYKGENNPNSKLQEKDVRKIRKKYTTGNYSHKQLSKEYDVTCGTIKDIVNRITWKHLK